MPALVQKLLKYAGYTAFFLVTLVVFVYLTAPLDAVEAYLVRKAADEYNTDLSIEELSMWGLSGVEAEGIVLRPRPTPDELDAIETSKRRLKEWKAARKSREEQAKIAAAEAIDEKAAAAKAGGDAGTGTAGAGPKGTSDAGTKKHTKPKATAKKLDDKPPKVPQGPRPVHVARLRAKLGLGDLLGGIFSGELEAEMLDGTVSGSFFRGDEVLEVAGNWSGLDVRKVSFLRRFVPFPIGGEFEGEVDLEIPVNDKGGLRLTSTHGHVDVKLAGAWIGPGRIETNKMEGVPFFDLPKARVGQVGGRLKFEKRRASFENFDISGKDVEGELTGFIQLASKLGLWGPRAHIRVKFSDEFLEKNKDVKFALTNSRYLKRGIVDGALGLSITRTLLDPKFTPRKYSPYKRRSTRRAKRAKPKKPHQKPFGARRGAKSPVNRGPRRPIAKPDARDFIDRKPSHAPPHTGTAGPKADTAGDTEGDEAAAEEPDESADEDEEDTEEVEKDVEKATEGDEEEKEGEGDEGKDGGTEGKEAPEEE